MHDCVRFGCPDRTSHVPCPQSCRNCTTQRSRTKPHMRSWLLRNDSWHDFFLWQNKGIGRIGDEDFSQRHNLAAAESWPWTYELLSLRRRDWFGESSDSNQEGQHMRRASCSGLRADWLGKYCRAMQEEKTAADEERLQKKQDLWPDAAELCEWFPCRPCAGRMWRMLRVPRMKIWPLPRRRGIQYASVDPKQVKITIPTNC